MPASNILIVAVDGLRASALGAYGNTSCETPALDQFAAESFLLDACYAPSLPLPRIYRALWHSLHPLRGDSSVESSSEMPSLPRIFNGVGYTTTLLTDDPAVFELPSAADFDDEVLLDSSVPHRAVDASATSLARLFATLDRVLESGPRLVWLHSRGMYGPWDAPLELQQALLDEGDPPPVEEIDPPDFFLSDSADPDTAFRYATAYAAQVIVLDMCWQGVMEMFENTHGGQNWVVVLVGTRGFPLGEHRRVGGVDDRLYADALHIPMLVRFPDGTGRLARTQQLSSHGDLLPTLVDWIGIADGSQHLSDHGAGGWPGGPPAAAQFDGRSLLPLATDVRAPWRDALIFASAAGHRAIRTPTWCLRQREEQRSSVRDSDDGTPRSHAPPALFVRPDDRWEVNDVAELCSEIVDGLTRKLDELARTIERGEPIVEDSLPEELKTPVG